MSTHQAPVVAQAGGFSPGRLAQIVGRGPSGPGDPPQGVADYLSDSGLTSLCLPRSLGGAGGGVGDLVRAVKDVARVDGSAAWCLFIMGTAPWLLAHADPRAVADVYEDPRARVAGALAPTGAAVRQGDGYVVDGRWSFGSGVGVSDWVAVHVRLPEEGTSAFALVPDSGLAYQEPWDGLGLWGTGSGPFAVEGEVVPAHRLIRDLASEPAWPEAEFAVPFRATFAAAAGVPLGIALGALDAYLALGASKTPTFGRAATADQPSARRTAARVAGALWSADASLREAVEVVQEDGARRERRDEHQARLRIAVNHACRVAVDAVDSLQAAAGSDGMSGRSVFARSLRDVHTVAQHYLFSDEIDELAGAVLLGRPADESRL